MACAVTVFADARWDHTAHTLLPAPHTTAHYTCSYSRAVLPPTTLLPCPPATYLYVTALPAPASCRKRYIFWRCTTNMTPLLHLHTYLPTCYYHYLPLPTFPFYLGSLASLPLYRRPPRGAFIHGWFFLPGAHLPLPAACLPAYTTNAVQSPPPHFVLRARTRRATLPLFLPLARPALRPLAHPPAVAFRLRVINNAAHGWFAGARVPSRTGSGRIACYTGSFFLYYFFPSPSLSSSFLSPAVAVRTYAHFVNLFSYAYACLYKPFAVVLPVRRLFWDKQVDGNARAVARRSLWFVVVTTTFFCGSFVVLVWNDAFVAYLARACDSGGGRWRFGRTPPAALAYRAPSRAYSGGARLFLVFATRRWDNKRRVAFAWLV